MSLRGSGRKASKCSSTASPHQNGCHTVQTIEYDANGNAYTTTAKFRKYDEYQRHWGPAIVWLGATGGMSGSLVWGPGVACLGAAWGS